MLSKADLAKRLADEMHISQSKATQMVNTILDTITEALSRGEEVRLTGFGTFRVAERAARTGRNPRTGEPITIAASRRPTFSPGTALTAAVQGKGKGERAA